MSGFDEFINILKETNKNKVSSISGINGIFEKINESIKAQNELAKVNAPITVNEVNRKKTEPIPKQQTEAEQKDEELKKRRNESNNIIMNKNSQSADRMNSSQELNLNGEDAFNLNFTSENVVQGFIFSEILGKPVCKRKSRSRRAR